MPECSLREFEQSDSDWLRAWYQADQKGMEALMGIDLPQESTYMAACNALFDTVLQGQARFWMLDREKQPMGFFLMTDFAPDNSTARVHIYVDPEQRRYSLKAAKSIEAALTSTLVEIGMKQVIASQPRDQRGAHALAKRMGFTEIPRVLLTKELQHGT